MFSNEQMLLLVLFGALLHSWLGAMLRYVWRHRQTAPGFQYWAWSEGLLGMAYLVMLVFFLLPNPAILLASTLLLTLSPLAYEHGLRRFFDDARLLPAWGGYAIASAGLLLQAAAMLWVDDVALRRATVNGSSLLQLLWLWPQVWLARRSRPYAQPLRALLWGLALLAALQGWRVYDDIRQSLSGQAEAHDTLVGLVVLLSLMVSIMRSLTDLVLVHARLEAALLATQATLAQRANTDSLSGLASRHAFEHALQQLPDSQPPQHVLLLIDIDHFKHINDSQGHHAGDRTLALLGRLLQAQLAAGELAGRLGGDELAVLLHGSPQRAANFIRQLQQAIAGQGGDFTLSIGISPLHGGSDYLRAYQHADQALYAAKHAGRNRAYQHDGQLTLPMLQPA